MADIIEFKDGQLVSNGYVEIDGVQHEVHEAVYEGETPISAYNLNELQKNLNMQGVVVTSIEPQTNRRKVWFQKGKNLIDRSSLLPGYISDANILINDTTYGERTSGLISVQSNKPYIFSIIQTTDDNPNWLAVAEYTKEGYFIKRTTNTNTQATQISFTAGSTTKFIRISARNLQNATKIQLEQNSLTTDYEEYVEPKIYVKNSNNIYEEFVSKNKIIVTTNVEFETGRIINGKKEYGKRLNAINLPSTAGNVTINTGLANIKLSRPLEGLIDNESNISGNLPFMYTGQPEVYHYFNPNTGIITIRSTGDMHTFKVHETIYYTKN